MSSRGNTVKRHMINVFDFDHTIYSGDASLDFYFYSIRRSPGLIRYIPIQAWHAFLYLLSINTRTQFKRGFFIFLTGIKDVDEFVAGFWREHERKVKKWYRDRSHDRDVIISASPEFIIAPIASRMRIEKLIATVMDKKTGEILGRNCRGTEKVRRLNKYLPDFEVEECYSDSLSDLPILNLAKNKYIVKKQQIIPYSTYKPSRLKKTFLRKSFLTFIFVGGLNAVIGLSFAFIMTTIVPNKTAAFMIGYCLGLIPSYFLNSSMTFRNREYNMTAFLKYCLSYIPNFIIQVSCVAILIEMLHINTIVSYIIAVVIGVPVTFLIVSVFAIKK